MGDSVKKHFELVSEAEFEKEVAKGKTINGLGVIGEQPRLKTNESFEYTSGTIIETPIGTMQGSYQMIADNGYRFDAEIPLFSLTTPKILN